MGFDIASVGGAIMKFVGADPMALIDKAAGVADRFIQTDDDKAAYSMELAKMRQSEQLAQMAREQEAAQIAHDERMAAYADTASARGIKGIGEYVQAGLAILFTVSFFALCVFILFWMKEAGLTPEQTNIIFLIFGAVSGIMVTIIGFYFGSSAGSKGKDDIIKNLQAVQGKQP